MISKLPKTLLLKLINFYPPFLGARIKIKMPLNDLTCFDVSMPLNFINRNYVGVHYGGSLYSMCDPFFMLIAMEKLGAEYIVWDKSASIKFVKPGRGKVFAHFEIDDSLIESVKKEVDINSNFTFELKVNVKNENNNIVAIVTKELWVGKKERP